MTPAGPSSPRRTWWLVGLLVALTLVAVVVDLARPSLTAPVRRAVATVAAPAQSALAGWTDGDLVELTRERNALAARVDELEALQEQSTELGELHASASWGVHDLLPARVVGFSSASSPVAGRTVTLDVGSTDGVQVDQSVVNVDGLVGRVVRVAPTSSDVVILGDPGVVVGVRFGHGGNLGTVRAEAAPGLPSRAPGELTLTALGAGEIREGDRVVTLGSADNIPYAARIPLGTVTSVDPDSGQLGATAAVRPFVDVDTLDLVGVVFVRSS
ncbi:rod shape-determining protein MreC [Ornithinicoccus hortensis]|uniref:Cell shape-determining protein MreC n=1 Tax=Ornithinicoccus hortensis TaxID=82346 RepID=A0A542YUA0_9MICO|nr:rod shape-determining protein MreC [Ornithinicoccus hortensis]TQL51663.1 rod shape-determining protein MreC [Ornithinicoccus hortensis]